MQVVRGEHRNLDGDRCASGGRLGCRSFFCGHVGGTSFAWDLERSLEQRTILQTGTQWTVSFFGPGRAEYREPWQIERRWLRRQSNRLLSAKARRRGFRKDAESPIGIIQSGPALTLMGPL